MLERIERLHRAANRRHNSYAEAVRDWEAYRLLASVLAAQLSMPWKVLGCDNPTQNISGSTNGANHIVLKEDLTYGPLHRKEHDALCKPVEKFNGNLFVEANVPSCKQCLSTAEKLV